MATAVRFQNFQGEKWRHVSPIFHQLTEKSILESLIDVRLKHSARDELFTRVPRFTLDNVYNAREDGRELRTSPSIRLDYRVLEMLMFWSRSLLRVCFVSISFVSFVSKFLESGDNITSIRDSWNGTIILYLRNELRRNME